MCVLTDCFEDPDMLNHAEYVPCIMHSLNTRCHVPNYASIKEYSSFSLSFFICCAWSQDRHPNYATQLSEFSFLLRFALQKHPILFLKKQKEPIKPKNAIEQNKQPFVMSSMGYQHLTITNASLAAKNHKKNTC